MGSSRNSDLPSGVSRYSRSAIFKKKALYKRTKNAAPSKVDAVADSFKVKKIGGDKNGGERKVPITRAIRYYPTTDDSKPMPNRKAAGTAKLRATITPGTVLILLAGANRGKRVVFLKQLASGLLLVTGPHKINGVGARRVNQRYVIATQTKVDITGVDSAKFDDAYFTKAKVAKAGKSADEFFADKKDKKVKTPVTAERAADQKALDTALLANIEKVANMKAYLHATFSLSNGQYPHEMIF